MCCSAFNAAKAILPSFSLQHALCRAQILPTMQPEGHLSASRLSNVLHQPCGVQVLSCMLHRFRACSASGSESMQVPVRSPPTPSWIHDFPVTQNYAVLPETPVVFNLKVGISTRSREVAVLFQAAKIGGRCKMHGSHHQRIADMRVPS